MVDQHFHPHGSQDQEHSQRSSCDNSDSLVTKGLWDHHFTTKRAYMKTESESLSAILKITIRMQEIFPALSKHIAEMPAAKTCSDDLTINMNNLKKYYNSLSALLKRYSMSHIGTAKLLT